MKSRASSSRGLPIVVGGFYRSGTSLLRRLLDSHSRIHCSPEVKFFKDFYGDYLLDELSHVRFFSTLKTLGLDESELLRIFGDAFISAHQLAAEKAKKIRWADKNPENVLYLSQWSRLLPDGFLFVYVQRHPLDALASLKEIEFRKTVPAAFVDKARLYLSFHRAAELYICANPESSVRVCYEDLVIRPQETLEILFDKLGESFEPEVLSKFHSAERGVGIEDPKVGHSQKVHSLSMGRWRRDLDSDELHNAKKILGGLIKGYE
jgi:hypothetical protein